jgi:hypothetical protein
MEKEVNVLGIISEILKNADAEIAAVFKKHFTEEELDNSAYAIMAYSLAWDAMREAEDLKQKAVGES